MTADPHITFLEEAARYFERLPSNGEDRTHWANLYNAKNCRDIANRLTAMTLPDTMQDGDRYE